jgi:hypothetical protein
MGAGQMTGERKNKPFLGLIIRMRGVEPRLAAYRSGSSPHAQSRGGMCTTPESVALFETWTERAL